MGRRVNQSMYYNRQSKGFQQNVMKKQMADAGYAKGMPKPIDPKKLKVGVIAGGIALAVLAVVLTIFFHWVGFFIGLGALVLATGGLVWFMRKKEKDIIRAYKRIGMPKKEYMNYVKSSSKGNIDAKTMKRFEKTWDKID